MSRSYKTMWQQAELNQEKMETACRVALSKLNSNSQQLFQLEYRKAIDQMALNNNLEHVIYDLRKGTQTLTGK